MPRSVRDILAHADELAQRFENYEPHPGDEPDPASLNELRSAVLRRSEAERSLQEAVDRARAQDHSWAAIGRVIGTTGEAARQKYGHKSSA